LTLAAAFIANATAANAFYGVNGAGGVGAGAGGGGGGFVTVSVNDVGDVVTVANETAAATTVPTPSWVLKAVEAQRTRFDDAAYASMAPVYCRFTP
jgi:hypothetical protein